MKITAKESSTSDERLHQVKKKTGAKTIQFEINTIDVEIFYFQKHNSESSDK